MPEPEVDPAESVFQTHRGMIILVIALGILIIFGVIGLIYGIATKAGKLGEEEPATVEVVDPQPAASLSPPSGLQVQSMTAAEGVLYLHIQLPDGREVVRAYDEAGAQVFEITP